MGLEQGVVLNERQREKLTKKLKKKWKDTLERIREIDTIIELLAKPKEVYDWTKDMSLSVNQPGYNPKKEMEIAGEEV